jgi:hypothetical protein
MSDDHSQELRNAIRERIADQRLPPEAPRSIVTHAGAALACDGCGAPIAAAERESEAELASGRVLRLHAACCVVWQDEAARYVSALIRAKVAAGTLPLAAAPPGKLWVGKGNGHSCVGCERPITQAEIEYEPDVPDGTAALRFHQRCLELWHQQCTEYKGMAGGCDVASIVRARLGASPCCRE